MFFLHLININHSVLKHKAALVNTGEKYCSTPTVQVRSYGNLIIRLAKTATALYVKLGHEPPQLSEGCVNKYTYHSVRYMYELTYLHVKKTNGLH